MPFSISRYLNTQMAYAPQISSDGQWMSFISNMSGIPQVWRVRIPEAGADPLWPQQLTFEGDRVQWVIASRAAGDNRLLYGRDFGGNENAQIYLLNADTGEESCLTTGYENAMHLPSQWSKDGRYLLFAANRRRPGIFDLYRHDLTTGQDEMIWEHDTHGYLVAARFSPDGRRVVVTRYQSNAHSEVFEITLSDHGRRKLSPEVRETIFLTGSYSKDGKSVFVQTDYQANNSYLARLDIESGAISPIYQDRWDVEASDLSPDGSKLVFAVNEEGSSQIYLHDLSSGQNEALTMGDIPGVMVSALDFSPDGSLLSVDYIRATRVSDVYVIDLKSKQARPVTASSHAGLPLGSFVSPELVHYPSFDKDENGQTRMIPAWFYRPHEQQGDVPVVVIVHGGPEAQSRPSFNPIAQHLLNYGYAVMLPNVRGSTGYGKVYEHLDDVEKRMDSVADLAHAAHWIKAQPGLDGERIVVYGGSYGGFMVLAAVTHYPELWVAGVDIVGVSNLVTFLENTSDYRRAAREAEYGTLANDREFLESIAPIHHIDRVKVPLLVIHGANDPRVPLSEAQQMVEALKQRNIPVDFLVFDDEGHGLVKLANKLVMGDRVVAFLDQYVRSS